MSVAHRRLLAVSFMLCVSVAWITCDSFADAERPPEESVEFGARQNPAAGAADKLGAFRSVFADVAEKVVPTVVSVIPTKVDTVVFPRNPLYHFFGRQSPFEFFGQPGQQQGKQGLEKRERRQQGIGSGVIVSEDGYILTNYHVVEGADEIDVKLSDGRMVTAKIVGSDSLSDVAVIKLDEEVDDLPVAYLGDSEELRTGNWVIAIGNPFSLTSSVTAGIVSALGRQVMAGNRYESFIQTDAAINPGNSGGALVNLDGELVGINTMIYSRSGGYMGIGFAIPIAMARRIMEDLIYKGEVVRGWIGVSIQDAGPATRDALDLDERTGVLVSKVYDGHPADKAGIERGDVILAIAGTDVSSANELRNVVATLPPGEKAKVVVFRDGKEKKLTLTVARREPEKLARLGGAGEGDPRQEGGEKQTEQLTGTLGIRVANLTDQLRRRYGIPRDTRGVVVTRVDPDAFAPGQALREGDVIRQVKVKGRSFTKVTNVATLAKTARGLEPGDAVMLLVQRDGQTFYMAYTVK